MPSAGFASPDVLFAGNSASPERRFYREVLAGLHERGYTRYVEVGVGSFAASLVAVEAGWQPTQMDTSDVTLYSSIVGTVVSGGDLNTLGVTLDGEPVELPDADLATQAAYLLWVQLRARMEARPDAEYWRNVVTDLTERADQHQAAIRKQITALQQRLEGIKYRPLDMWEHFTEAVGDPRCVVLSAPPSYRSGFEKFFDTGGRLNWSEPKYDLFDPATGFKRLASFMDGVPALSLCLQETEPPNKAHPKPVFATPVGAGRHAYVITNRPDEVFEITGGPKVVPRRAGEISPSQYPPMPFDYTFTPDSKVELLPVKSSVSDYYRDIWLHRLTAVAGSYNTLVVIDGYVACVIGYSVEPITRPYSMQSRWSRHVLLRYGVGAPNGVLRTGRLATMFALQYGVAELSLGMGGAVYLAASKGLITVQMTRFPESKEMRGLMKLANKQPHPDGFKLTYEADWQRKTHREVLAEFLAKEERWRRARQNSK